MDLSDVKEQSSLVESERSQTLISPETPLKAPVVQAATEGAMRDYWQKLRLFFRSAKFASDDLFPETSAPQPIQLSGIRDCFSSEDYPFWINAPVETGQTHPDFPLCSPLKTLMVSAGNTADPSMDVASYQMHVENLFQNISQNLAKSPALVHFKDCLDQAISSYLEALPANMLDSDDTLREDLAFLKKNLPSAGFVLPYSRFAPLMLLRYASSTFRTPLLSRVIETIDQLKAKLSELISVEDEKSADSGKPEALHGMLEFAEDHISFDALSKIEEQPGSESMPAETYLRIQKAISALATAKQVLAGTEAYLIVSDSFEDTRQAEWDTLFKGCLRKSVREDRLAEEARQTFDKVMLDAAKVFAALRTARLEIQDQYVAEIHDVFFEHFDWRNLTDEEMHVCPPVIIIAGDQAITGPAMSGLSQLLSTYRPIKIVSIKGLENADTSKADPSEQSEFTFTQEPGIFVAGHRHTHVMQVTAFPPVETFQAFSEGFSSELPGLFRILVPPHTLSLKDEQCNWLNAAVTSRFFPQFSYNQQRSARWGGRFDISSNQQTQNPWPAYTLQLKNPSGGAEEVPLHYTNADFAYRGSRLYPDFCPVPPEYWSENLVPLHEYLSLSQTEMYGKVPYIHAIGVSNTLVRLAVSWRIVLASQERLDFWNFLQENAGTSNIYVEKAIRETREVLMETHLEELEKVRQEDQSLMEKENNAAVEMAVNRMLSALLELGDPDKNIQVDMLSTIQTDMPAGRIREKLETLANASEVKEPVAKAKEVPKAEISSEAWIESDLCTSCNDCIDINKNIFKYNGNKQAYVADPKGGPYKDIVKAAEKCPAEIIHPGLPQHPGEKNLEALIKRAERFN